MNYNIKKKIFPLENLKDLKNLNYDEEGLWSISHPDIADLLCMETKKFSNEINIDIKNVLDITAGIGGNLLSFAKYFENVLGVEVDLKRFNILKKNLHCYNYNNIECINCNCFDYINSTKEKFDMIFIDPPWGGPNYKNDVEIEIKLDNYTMYDLIELLKKKQLTKLLVFKLPYNFTLDINNATKIKKIKCGNIIFFMIYLP